MAMKQEQLRIAQENLEKGLKEIDKWLRIWAREAKRAQKEEGWNEWGKRMEKAIQKVRERRVSIRTPKEDLKGSLEDCIELKLMMEEVVDLAREVLGEERAMS